MLYEAFMLPHPGRISLLLFPFRHQSLRYSYQSPKPHAEVQPFKAKGVLASNPLLLARAALSGECLEKLENFWK
jgi:hypothetical protein